MKKVCRKWKVFLIVLCMLFTMTPTAVFAEQTDGLVENQQQLENRLLLNNDDPPGNDQQEEEDQPSDEIIPDGGSVQMMNTMCCGKGSITVIKKITGDRPESDATFSFTLTGPDNYSCSFNIVGERQKKIEDLYPGDYTITEADVVNYTTQDNGKTIKVKAWENTKFKFYNMYTASTTGTITIHKEVIGNPGSSATFSFKIEKLCGYYPYFWYEYVDTADIVGAGTSDPVVLTKGFYKITEQPVENYSVADDVQSVNVKVGKNKDVTFENTYTGPAAPTSGSITITKEIEGDDPPEQGDQFDFTVGNTDGFTGTISVTGEGSCTIDSLLPGTYTITEAAIDNYIPRENGKTVEVTAGENAAVTFVNDYDAPLVTEPAAFVTKKVAPYDGLNIPSESSFKKYLELDKLDEKVIYKIDITCNGEWLSHEKYAGLFDIYDRKGNDADITGELLVWNEDSLVKADDVEQGFPYDVGLFEGPKTYYYVDQLTENGTYTNTSNLYESFPFETPSESESEVVASASAVVVVDYEKPSNGGGSSGGSSHRYYKVTYDSNYPSGGSTAGAVPVDGKSYSYNNSVNVKGNTGDLNAGSYVFVGWNTEQDGSGTAYQPGSIFNIKDNVTLYAQWKLMTEGDTETIMENGEPPAASGVDQDAGLDDVPKTGDFTPLLPMMLLGLFSLGALLVFGRRYPEAKRK